MKDFSFLRHPCWMLALLLSIATGATAVTPKDYFTQERIAELIRRQLSEKYRIEAYRYRTEEPQVLADFQLGSGEELLYGTDGQLMQRKTAEGEVVVYQQGLPLKRLDKKGQLISETEFIYNDDHHLVKTITHEQDRRIVRLYHQQKMNLEIDTQGYRLYIRYGFALSDDMMTVSYFETQSLNGLTYWITLDKRTNIIDQQWFVTGGLGGKWDNQYLITRRLIIEEIENQFKERHLQKRDSFNRTKGDLIISELKQKKFYSFAQFMHDRENKKIVVDPQWKFVECNEVTVVLPRVQLIKLKQEVIEKAIVKNKKVFVWNDSLKDWKSYPYNPVKEKIMPLGIDNKVIIEPRSEEVQWQMIKDEVDYYIIDRRLLISDDIRKQQMTRGINPEYVQSNEDDYQKLVAKTRLNYRRAQESVAWATSEDRLGKKLKTIHPDMLEQIQLVITAQQKQRIKNWQEWKSTDENRLGKFQFLLSCLIPEQVLSLQAIQDQKNTLFIKDMGPFYKIAYRKLKIEMPIIIKDKQYIYYNKVKNDRNVIKIWEEDSELPEQGYWRIYVLRVGRDRLIKKNNRLMIESDQGQFFWKWNGKWQQEEVTGQFYLPKSDQKN